VTDASLSPSAAAVWRPPFEPGDPAPWFAAPTPASPRFHFNTVTARFVLLGFLPEPGPARDAALAQFVAHRGLFDDDKLTAFIVLRDEASMAKARNQPPGLRWFFDPEGEVNRTYGALDPDGTAHPYWILLDPMLRTYAAAPAGQADGLFASLAGLPPVEQHAGVELTAPVVVVPRVFEPELCRRLIDIYEARGGSVSGVMRDIGGKTVGVLDDFKRRRDVFLEDDPGIRAEITARLNRRLLPEIKRVFQFEATRLERYLVACYDAEEGGYFRPHRDNEALATRHRKFAVSINLNAEQFEGGDLRFPEFGRKTYRPPTGGAVVFACGLQHEATPVTKGRRYAFLPFLYDEAGQVVREANAGLLDPTPAKPQTP
jgi:predicted 2-oxoglutarate/Fe(II)-dependent dioxygenase YbiX